MLIADDRKHTGLGDEISGHKMAWTSFKVAYKVLRYISTPSLYSFFLVDAITVNQINVLSLVSNLWSVVIFITRKVTIQTASSFNPPEKHH